LQWGSLLQKRFFSALTRQEAGCHSLDDGGGKTVFGIGMPELLIILVIILIIFGAGKLPQIGEGLGKGIRNSKIMTKDQEEIDGTAKKVEDKKSEDGCQEVRRSDFFLLRMRHIAYIDLPERLIKLIDVSRGR
jgi:sec-independent protein translocase protein TatA